MMVAELNPVNELTLHNLNNQTVPLVATQQKGDPHPLMCCTLFFILSCNIFYGFR